jgi:tripartite-type tricarboxylate transporter receptor subunit TctC
MKLIAAMAIRPAIALAIGLAALVSSQSASLAQTKQIKLIVPYAPGGAPDVAARVLGEEIGRAHNVTVVVENRPGAGSIIASELVARAVPDGNTILIISTSFVTNPHLHKVTYDPLAFAPICQLVSAPSMLAVGPKSPYKSVADFLDAARQNPGKVTVASPGPGTTFHIGVEMLKRAANVNVTYVPYPATPPALNALLGGHVDAVFSDIASMSGQLKAGTIRPIVTALANRIPSFPDVPTLGEAGYKGFNVETWFGVMAPPKTPDNTTAELVSWFTEALRSDAVRQKFTGMGFGAGGRCGADLGSFLRQNYETIGQAVRDANMKVE